MKLFPTFSKFSFEDIAEYMEKVVKRFPLSVIAVFVMTVLAIYLVHLNYDTDTSLTVIGKTFCAAIVLLFLGVTTQLLFESGQVKQQKYLYGFTGIFLVLYIFWLPSDFSNATIEFWGGQLLIILGFLALVFAAPFVTAIVKRKEQVSHDLYVFGLGVLKTVAKSAIYSLIIFILGAILLATLSGLFELSFVTEKRYMEWFIISFLFLGFLQILGGIPTTLKGGVVPQGVTLFFTKRIALPFIALYTAILYIYFLLILTTGEWPVGMVPWLAMWFSFFSFAAYAAAYPYQDKFKVFQPKFIPYVLILPIALLFYGILVRIDAYGFTVNRYLVLVFGVWIVGMVLYYIFSKRKELGIIPLSLAIVSFAISVGPWSAFNVSKNDQQARLTDIVSYYQLGTADARDIPNEEANSARTIIAYLCEYHGCDSLAEPLGAVYGQAYDASEQKDRYSVEYKIVEILGIPQYYPDEFGQKYLSIVYDYVSQGGSIPVDQYDSISHIDINKLENQTRNYVEIVEGRVLLHIGLVAPVDATEVIMKELESRGGQYETVSEPVTLTLTQGTTKILLYPEQINGNNSDGIITIEYIRALVLIDKQ